MALYTRDSIERLRDAVDMAELVGSKTDLRRVGSRLTGLCPFHDERTPSFSVNAQDKLFYCFGCHAKGDAIGFVEQTEGLDFREAVEFLAERYGVELELENEDPQAEARRRRRERLLALLDRAARFYESYLWESAEASRARDYLAGRGLSEEVLRQFRVGYSPSAWDRMLLGARQSGFSEEELMAAGLAQRGRDGRSAYDRFRGRIMFPLADGRGRVLGFGARQMGEGRGPKYLNTSENELYHKGRQLFGLDIARREAAKTGRIVVVEGYTDVLALHQAGIREAVAIMGTALTQEQLAEAGRAASTLVLALDADRSGQEAMLRASRLAEERGLELRVVEMPEGTDPAELVTSGGPEEFQGRMERAVPVIEFQVRRVLADADLDTPSGRDKALGEARKLIFAVPERTATRDALVREAADRLDVPVDYVLAAPAPAASRPPSRGGDPGSEQPPPAAPTGFGEASLAAERAYLTMCLASGVRSREYLERLSEEHLSSPALRAARAHLASSFDDPLAGLPEDDPATAAVITGVAMAAQEQVEATEPVLRMSYLQLELRRIERELRRAAHAEDNARRMELAGARQQVRRDMDQVMGQTA
jgi:DNA primase